MKIRTPHPAPSLIVSFVALSLALGGTSYAAGWVSIAGNAEHLGGYGPSHYQP
jgi:hypothetical protein